MGNNPATQVIAPMLRALDQLLAAAIDVAQSTWGAESVSDRFRGLYVGRAEAEGLLQREPGAPNAGSFEPLDLAADASSPFAHLRTLYSLDRFDLSVIAIALAPEVDLKYERLYGYLQDDVTRKRPTVDLALNLLTSSANEKLERRERFDSHGPLLRHHIVHLLADGNYTQPPLLAHYLKVDDQILAFLLGNTNLDGRIAGYCQIHDGANTGEAWPAVVNLLRRQSRKLIIHFRGSSRTDMRGVAQAAAGACGVPLLAADFSSVEAGALTTETVALVLREAAIRKAIPYLEVGEGACQPAVSRALEQTLGTAIVAFSRRDSHFKVEGIRVIPVNFPFTSAEGRLSHWERALTERNAVVAPTTLGLLANRFRLNSEQIDQAVEEACANAEWRQAGQPSGVCHPDPSPEEMYTAARGQTGCDLSAIARKLEPVYTWDDLVLPSDTLNQLREICHRISHREHVLGRWGFDRKLSLGKGATALFAGPSGTGKTMAAEVIANETKLDLFAIDLAGVVSKYIGETEKNLDRIFVAAYGTNAILFFDEADALFGKRSEVRDSHDRYANIEISYLLQKMESYDGVVILASNLRQHMDESFIRRLAFTVHFPFPDEAQRLRIWRGIWPPETPVSDDVDFGSLANRFKLSGGNIKNVALAAAFLAAADGGLVGTAHLLHAIEREYQKMGKTIRAGERLTVHEPMVMS